MAGESAPARSRTRRNHAAAGENVGQQLRKRREQEGLSLREVARRLGISPSALSQIETGKSRASVSTLYAIVSELGMSLDELFGGRPGKPAAAAPARPASPAGPGKQTAKTPSAGTATPVDERFQPHDERAVLDLESGVRWERLTARPDPEADFLYVTYDVGGSSSGSEQFIRHSGREYGLVLSGTLEVTVGFETYSLGPGDSISFDSSVPHRLRNTGTEPVHGVWFVIGREADTRTQAFFSHDGSDDSDG
jgi:mannose-6-phosphate isomerase-like protein (cupin superfamily)/DNA-binding XRE family transcriptional regulator